MNISKKILLLGISTVAIATSVAAQQELNAGLTTNEIVFGRAASFSGPEQMLGKQMRIGFESQFRQLNDDGGVFGRKIKMLEYDDAGKEAKTAEGAEILFKKYSVFALLGTTGAKSTKAVIPLINKYKIPLIGPYSGDISVSQDFNKYVFSVQANYLDQIKALAEHAGQSGVKTIAIIQDDVGDARLAQIAVDEFKKRGVMAVVAEGIDSRSTPEGVKVSIDRIVAKSPQSVIAVGTSTKTASALSNLAAVLPGIQIFAIPTKDTISFAKEMGEMSYGVVTAQVTPLPFKGSTELVSEYKSVLTKYYPKEPITFVGLQAFATAKVITEALKKSGSAPTREKFISALESLKTYDVGGFVVNYSPTQHAGSQFVEVVMIGKSSGKETPKNWLEGPTFEGFVN